jgi:hypothetical protein
MEFWPLSPQTEKIISDTTDVLALREAAMLGPSIPARTSAWPHLIGRTHLPWLDAAALK